MFEEHPNVEQIGPEVYIYKNFLSKEEADDICSYIDAKDESEWFHPIEGFFIKNLICPEKISFVRDKLKTLLPDYMLLGESTNASKMVKGDKWGVHADVYDFAEVEQMAKEYVEGTPYEIRDLSIYGTVVYLNDFEGGEIFYPNLGIIYKPNPGDLVIHSSAEGCSHGVAIVKSEKRYAYSNHMYAKVKVPK